MERRRRGRSSWLLVGIVGVSIVLVASLWSLLKPPQTNQTSLSKTPPATAPSTTLPRATTTTKPKPRGVTLVLHYVGASWTKVATDGKVSFRGTGTASDRRTFRAKQKIDLTLGAPAQVQVEVNGQPIQPDCKGCVWQHSFTLDSLKQGATNSAEGASGSSGQSGGTSGTSSNRSGDVTTSTRSTIG
ncbi:MAG TPA: DUF4115 domain-containing protein [Actinomycetes bacterium]|nr:DUF4115 domain-containing protein [Actinomycetes bacterium]